MNNIMVTVYCITYNHEKYIKDALEGIISQKTKFSFEVLVHDDASTDGTADIVKQYEKKYPLLIKGIYQEENTYIKQLNRIYSFLLPRTNGKYVAFCEGDDYWVDEHKLQMQVDYMESHPECSLITHEAFSLLPEGEKMQYTNYSFDENRILNVENIMKNHLLFPTASMLFPTIFFYKNKEFLLQHRMFDYLLKTMLAMEGYIYVIPKVMSVYRCNSNGSWTERVGNDVEKYIKHEEYAIKCFEDLDKYQNFKYHNILENNILRRNYHIEELRNHFSMLRREPYRQIYKEKPLKIRILIRIREILSKLYKILLILRNKR